ncbi:MAG: hypothetical protein ABH857_00300 [Elusimicrobiota bacterium]
MKKLASIVLIIVMFSLSGCGDTNFFSWTHKAGSKKTTEALTADGQSALAKKDYDGAYAYFSDAIAKDSSNSEARYGRAQAAYGKAGISLSSLLASALQNMEDDNGMISTFDIVQPSDLSPDSLIPDSIGDLKNLYDATAQVVEDLKIIADGHGNGVIPADDPDVNINLAFAQLIQGVLFVLDSNADGYPGIAGDLVQVNKDYTVTEPKDFEWNALKADAVALDKFKKQVQKGVIYVLGTGAKGKAVEFFGASIYAGLDSVYSSFRGSIEYLDTAINSGSLPKTGILYDLKTNFTELVKQGEGIEGDDFGDLWNEINS